MSISEDEGGERFRSQLARELAPVGIREDMIRVEYQGDLQDYEVHIDGDELTDNQIAALRQATRLGGVLSFTNIENSQQLSRAEAIDGRELMKARAAQLRLELCGLPQFDAKTTTLAMFARELETYANIEPGTVLVVTGTSDLRVDGICPHITFSQLSKLMSAVTATLADHDEIEIWMTGREAE